MIFIPYFEQNRTQSASESAIVKEGYLEILDLTISYKYK